MLALGTTSWACSCVPDVPCGAHRYLDADFVGEIVSRSLLSWHDGFDSNQLLFKVRVIESFRGSQKVGEIVDVKTGHGGGDCGYAFKVGNRYLIDASKNNDALSTGICSLTAPVEKSEVELRTLRSIAAGQRTPDFAGVLMNGIETQEGEAVTQPLPGVHVWAKSIRDGTLQETVTDGLGSFTFATLPEGTYQLTLGLPNNLSAAYTNLGILADDQVPPVSIKNKNADSVPCHIKIVAGPSGNISGVVQISQGTPIEGWVNADTVAPDGKPWNTVRSITVGLEGKFSLAHLKPGRYIVQFTSRAGFVPGKPQVIELTDGEHHSGVVLEP
jgi:hypothetical protein